MVGRDVSVSAPPDGWACCVGAWPASWWGVLCSCLPAAVVLRGVLVLSLGCCRLCSVLTGIIRFGLVVL